MSAKALFVDLPNFYSRLLSSGIDDARMLRDYFLYWFDFDRLAEKLTGDFSSVWVFYSGRRFGPQANRIQDQYLDGFINRINALTGVTAHDVNIPGEQREPTTYRCEQCGHEGAAQWESEKGIDASLTVHLFDTLDSWDTAYLLSGDADFVPTVASLRRRGKIVIGAGFSDASSALVRECYDYIDLRKIFLTDDVAAYQIFKKEGIAHKWLFDEVQCAPGVQDHSIPIALSFEWQRVNSSIILQENYLLSIENIRSEAPVFRAYFTAEGPIDLSSRYQQIEQFQAKFPLHVEEVDPAKGCIRLVVSPLAWNGVQRRLEDFTSSLSGLLKYEARLPGQGYTIKYSYDTNTNRYVVST